MKFTKMHGLGNDFILIDCRFRGDVDFHKIAQTLTRRRFSIGADELILILPSKVADLKMRIFNPDGREAEMCGNGIRCFARYVYERGIINRTEMEIETLAGIIRPSIINCPDAPGEILVKVNMGKPEFQRCKIPMTGEDSPQVIDEIIEINGNNFVISAVSMGNPHCVLFVDKLTDEMVRQVGPQIEHHPLFPAKTNVEFVKIENPQNISIRVWERGAGETLACGTGACASVVIGVMKGVLERDVLVSLPGGNLQISWNESGDVFMTGPAVEVFQGEITIEGINL